MHRRFRSGALTFLILLLASPATLRAQVPFDGTVSGAVFDASTHAPLEDASVVLRGRSDTTRVSGTTAAKDGSFLFAHVRAGTYVVECSQIGHRSLRTPEFTLDAAKPAMRLPGLALKASALVLDEVVISSARSLFNQNIDRRVYNVDHDLMAKASSASDLLQNIPSVQVDVDGNVSLRGSSDVMILVNGRKSPLMGASRADVLQQLPAASIEKIEVITNPSARFTPEGASGIINIVTRKGAASGISGDLTAHAGTAGRTNESGSLSWHPAKLSLFGNYSHRDDRRTRIGTDQRTFTAPGFLQSYGEDNRIAMHPRVHMGTVGLEFQPDEKNSLELSGDYFRRRPTRDGLSTIVTRDAAGALLTDHDRLQTGYELETETGVNAALEHGFAKEDRSLRLEAGVTNAPQEEAARFVEYWRAPAQPDPVSDVVLRQSERTGRVSLDYHDPLGGTSRREAGYALDVHHQDIHSDADSLDVGQGTIVPNAAKTYRFRLDQTIQALYATYGRTVGQWSALAGLRGERAVVTSPVVTGAPTFSETRSGLYPTLHVTWQPAARHQFQANYSRRIRRPDSEDLNPFPEYTDPYNISSGNPRLKPESIDSYELGYRLTREHFSFAPTAYLRNRHDGFSQVTRAIDDSTFLRTEVNLASDRSAGIEPVVTFSAGRAVQANLNGNVFYEQIDASNLGYAGTRSVVSWSGTLNFTVTPRPSTMVELGSNWRSARLSPQGTSRPSYVVNLGARQNLLRDRLSLTAAISDLFKTQKQDTRLDVAGIRQHVTRRRDWQIVYVGATWHYGRPAKQDKKDKPIQYEDQP